ncbi:kinase-like domain-containing protein [Suillus plorans]|uniref:Kinase-like domain-containing protein n=1 Tax=Suillus plorans TaxID=116603 RepID=A0A9P7AAT4_9AGAM|nr:kinase-like domain-containing protein [Suillus plorans]KAG1785248.1 kinase-like domain-containing protein [Suillus plorans]
MISGLIKSLSPATTTASLSRSSKVTSQHERVPLAWGLPPSRKLPDEYQITASQTASGSDLDQDISRQLITSNNEHAPLPESGGVSMSPAMMFLSAFNPSAIPQSPDAEGEIIRGYVLGPIIGYGGFSVIRRASSPSGGVVAVKIVRRTDLEKQTDPSLARRRLNHEAQIWASLCHEHTLPLFFSEHTPYADFFFSLLCPAGSLYDILLRDGRPALPHDDAGMMFRQIVRGVRYLHEVAGYVHRDIKLENVLVDEMGICRICDFGMTRKIGEVDGDEPLSDADNHSDNHSGTHRHRSTSNRPVKSNTSSHLSILRHHRPRRHRISTPIGENPPPVHPSHVFQQGSLPYASPELLQPKPSRFKGVYDMPSGISRGAEHVLKGCLERDVRTRWTIATVDEMAWGVGLDDDDDDDTSPVTDKDKFELVDYPSRRSPSLSQSRSRPCARRDNKPNPPHTEEAPPRLSNRSLSRASVSTASSLSTRCTSRSISRPPVVRYPMSPTYNELSHSVVSASTSLSVPPLDIGGPTLLASPGPSPERGRRPKKAGFLPPPRCTPSLATSSRQSEYAPESGDLDADVDVLGDTSHWTSTLGIDAVAGSTARRSGMTTAIERLKAIQDVLPPQEHKRAESTPPASGAWLRRSRLRIKEDPSSYRAAEVHGAGGFLRDSSTTPIPITPKGGTRSRSVGHDTRHAYGRTR